MERKESSSLSEPAGDAGAEAGGVKRDYELCLVDDVYVWVWICVWIYGGFVCGFVCGFMVGICVWGKPKGFFFGYSGSEFM